MTAEASKSAEWLGIEIEQVFNVPLIGIGDGSVNGNTRTEIVSARERTRVQILDKALSLHLPKKTRPAWAWRQRDKLSSSWLLALPGSESHLNNTEFSEAAASSLCLPSPACLERLGEVIRNNKKVDQYGDNVQACPLPGDHWRKRHDLIKNSIYRLCQWAGLPCEVEVFNLFSRYIPQQGLSRLERDRDRQGLVPDLKITLTVGGQTSPVLHEVKCISSSETRYKPTMIERGVDRRANQLHNEYVGKARKADQQFGGTLQGEVGQVERKLLTFPKVEGLVFGNWGEGSQAVHSLVEALAVSRSKVAIPQIRSRRGAVLTEEGIKGIAVGYLRRKLSITAIKAQCLSLLGRLEGLGSGAAAAVGRRARVAEQERLWANERQAQHLANRIGANIHRKGFGKLT